MKELKYPSKKTINKFTQELKLEGAHEFTQDWEYEVADVNQLTEYIEYYQNDNLTINEKTTLMRMILEAYNDFCVLENREDIYGEMIKELLKKDYIIHEETIKYWACEEEELGDCFAITPFIRRSR